MTRGGARRLAGALAVLALAACGREEKVPRGDETTLAPHALERASLRAYEAERRATTDFTRASPSDAALGPDPYAIVAVPSPWGGYVGVLRGRGALVRLDADLVEEARVDFLGATAVAVDGDVAYVVGERNGAVGAFRITARGFADEEASPPATGGRRALGLPNRAGGLRGIAAAAGVLYGVDERDDLLVWSTARDGGVADGSAKLCGGPFRVARAGPWVVAACLFSHEIVAVPVDAAGVPQASRALRARHDGPFWGFDARADGEDLVVAAGGVEDHPLDRTEGSFGFIDSFVYVYRFTAGAAPRRELAVNVSELGVVTPKAIALDLDPGGAPRVLAVGAASGALALLAPGAAPKMTPLPPGVVAIARAPGGGFVGADPLLDAWVDLRSEAARVVPARDDAKPRAEGSRLGEALFFTTLMAPWNRAEGRLSRFTCETCHFEGYVDGRTHATGRGDVRATTKPLLGLFNNRPHFSRALDADLASMVDHEFTVANAKGHAPWFDLRDVDARLRADLRASADVSGVDLRRALMAFLIDFAPRDNPAALGRRAYTDVEARGAATFQTRCVSCHAARTVADDAATDVPFARWEDAIFARGGPIVWGQNRYEKTGIEPYVHSRGARVPSLRRLYKKRPYFTNGSAPTIASVLDGVRFGDGVFSHAGGEGAVLTGDERASLEAFLELL